MRTLGILLTIFALLACGEKVSAPQAIYDFDIKAMIAQDLSTLTNDQTFEKSLWVKGKLERVLISKEQYQKFVEGLSLYDINKVAYKNAFKFSEQGNIQSYHLGESKLPLKKLYVHTAESGNALYIYYDNSNNLFSSRHVVQWKMYEKISVYRITKIWGMDADSTLIQIRRK